MNILFLTLVEINSLEEKGIYQDLLRKFLNERHNVFVVTPNERRKQIKTNLQISDKCRILSVKTLNIQKTNIVEKGIGVISIEYQYLSAIKKYFNDTRFDLVLYSTPPITFSKVIRYIKKRDNSKSYLLLKDIFPQNAADIGLMRSNSFIYKFFRNKEKKLYAVSDFIGCMSPANVEFVLKYNPEINAECVEVCPNSIELSSNITVQNEKNNIRNKFGIPDNATTFIYGGNLGKPQGLGFLLHILESNNNKKDRFFIIVGSGTEYPKIKQWFDANKPQNAFLQEKLSKTDYDLLVQCCDVGLIFLDPRFTIPNYPSRLLSYLEYKMPVLMATDKNTDIGTIARENGYGVWTENGNLKEFNSLLDKFCDSTFSIEQMGEKGYEFLKKNYTVDKSYEIIMKHFQ